MPSSTFVSLGVPADLADALRGRGITAPFPIQAATIPDGLAGHDICGRAPTGSGKTLAFGLALAVRTKRAEPRKPTALVLVPTRELAAQVEKELTLLGPLRVATVYGGVGYGDQRRALQRGVDVLVACPGRLEDLLEQRDLSLNDARTVVIDEADRMADMGFLPAVRRILDRTPPHRQTLLFSATLDGDVDVLIKKYQRNPRRHSVATSEDRQGDVRHVFWNAERDRKLELTQELIERHTTTIVFTRTRHGADRLAKQLGQRGVSAAAIHGSRTQPQRDKALAAFTDGRVRALIATDVAARGIHVDDVACVVHYDTPATSKDYVHRSGRTGRAGADGLVVSLVQREAQRDVRTMQKELKLPKRVDAPDLGSMPDKVEWTKAPRPEGTKRKRPGPKRKPHGSRPHKKGVRRRAKPRARMT